MKQNIERMKALIGLLQEASKEYYANNREIMSNYEYDGLYDELEQLEQTLGMTLANSPTVQVGYEAVDALVKEAHESRMLSLDKTKEPEALQAWLGNKEGLLSYKLDGLTVVLTYHEGALQKAVTRGNGEIGEVITSNAKVFLNLPLVIPYEGTLILRGEAVISYANFEKINEQIDQGEEQYKNPRNLCSGSVRQLNNEITAKRMVEFYAFALVSVEEDMETREEEFRFLEKLGFAVVEYHKVTAENIQERISQYAIEVSKYPVPSDGLVLCYNDIAYGQSLGTTAKFPRDAMAFKWQDECAETTLLDIEWSPSRTGLINPVAIFTPVELEGTTVSRASVHNISVMRQLELGVGDTIEVYKANMIIPQIAKNHTRSNKISIPELCPACGSGTEITMVNEVASLYCTNPFCEAKKIKAFTLLVSRNALNVDGLSEATLGKLLERGYIEEFADLFHLSRYKEELIQMDGFGEKSYEKLIRSMDAARNTTFARVLYGLGIPNIGTTNAKVIGKHFGSSFDALLQASEEELSEIEGVGSVIARSILTYFADEEKYKAYENFLAQLYLEEEQVSEGEQYLQGKVFVITGSLERYGNRDELKAEIEQYGGKVTGSVTKNTDYLINNAMDSPSSKNKKAKELEIPILTEEQYEQLVRGGSNAN